jgi:uncharacterized cupin superfamily protein
VVPEAKLVEREEGMTPEGEGWYVLNARDARWRERIGLGRWCFLEAEPIPSFEALGFQLAVLDPGVPACMYHGESDQEDFLVVAGECVLIIEGEERRLRAWDFVHCPPGTKHIVVGAGDGPCALVAVGAREHQDGPGWGGYPVDETAIRHGAGVETETTVGAEAYASWPKRRPGPYQEGGLPG